MKIFQILTKILSLFLGLTVSIMNNYDIICIKYESKTVYYIRF